jgi:hypothetical protein
MKENIDPDFVLTIEIEEGKVEKINLFFDSNPEQVAYDFCKEKNLDFSALKYLTRELESLLKEGQRIKKENHIGEDIKEVSESQENRSDEIRKSKMATERNTILTHKTSNDKNSNKVILEKLSEIGNPNMPQQNMENKRNFIPNSFLYKELSKSLIKKSIDPLIKI